MPHGEPLEPDLLDEVQEVANPNTGREITSRQDRAEDQIDIDVLFLYTAAAESAFGGPEGTQNTINLSVTESNLGFRNSAIPVRLDIAHTHKVDIDEDQYSFSQLLSGITDTEDGMADEIHQLRDLYGADVVMLLVDRPLLCGISYQMKSLSLGNSRYAFNVVHQSCATGYYSVAHEIGHNLGSQHDRAHTSSSGIYPYSHGFQDPLNRFRTIMAYNCPVTCTRINHWSNPNVYFEGEAITGVAAGHPYAADNHLSIKETARVVSNYRTQVIEQKETLIINFQASELDGVASSVQDDGGIFKTHASGYTYGWNQIYANGSSSEDPDSGSVYVPIFGNGGPPLPEWQIALPDGRYQLSIAFGPEVDPATIADPELSFYVEDQLWEAWPAADPKPYSILEGGISLTDGRLSIRQDAGELILHHVTITRIDTETLLSLPVDPDFVQSPSTKKVYLPLVQMTNDEVTSVHALLVTRHSNDSSLAISCFSSDSWLWLGACFTRYRINYKPRCLAESFIYLMRSTRPTDGYMTACKSCRTARSQWPIINRPAVAGSNEPGAPHPAPACSFRFYSSRTGRSNGPAGS